MCQAQERSLWFRPIPLVDAVDASEGAILIWSRNESGMAMQTSYIVESGEGIYDI